MTNKIKSLRKANQKKFSKTEQKKTRIIRKNRNNIIDKSRKNITIIIVNLLIYFFNICRKEVTMKKFGSLLVLALVVLSWLSGCGGKGGGSDKEPNNSIEEAGEITLDESFPIKINPKGDVDWFKVELPEQGYLNVQAGECPEELNLEVAFALYKEWEGEKEERIRGWKRLPDAVSIPKGGTYYFAVKDDHDDASSQKAIQIKASFLKEFDPFEPNDKPEEAKLVEVGSVVKPVVYPKGDVDWLKVKIGGQGYLVLKTNNVPEGINPEASCFIFDEWADPKVKEIRGWKKFPNACVIPDSGEYCIKLHDDYDDAASETPYDLKIEFLEEMDKNEPNDEFSNAKTIKRGDTLTLAIFPERDRDYYKIKTTEAKNLKFMAKGFSEIIPEIKLMVINENNPNQLKEASKWKRLPADFEVEGNKEYFILIHDDYDDVGSPVAFQLMVE
jgi:hypothetical protein